MNNKGGIWIPTGDPYYAIMKPKKKKPRSKSYYGFERDTWIYIPHQPIFLVAALQDKISDRLWENRMQLLGKMNPNKIREIKTCLRRSQITERFALDMLG